MLKLPFISLMLTTTPRISEQNLHIGLIQRRRQRLTAFTTHTMIFRHTQARLHRLLGTLR